MNQKDLKRYEALLRAEQAGLERRIVHLGARTPNDADGMTAAFPEFGEKDEDNAAEVATFQDNLSVESNLEANLTDVKRALGKIADGTYGICEQCGRPIEPKRLAASPTARRCLEHA